MASSSPTGSATAGRCCSTGSAATMASSTGSPRPGIGHHRQSRAVPRLAAPRAARRRRPVHRPGRRPGRRRCLAAAVQHHPPAPGAIDGQPAERFTSATGGEAERLLPLRLPAILSPVPATQDHRDTGPAPVSRPAAAAVPTYDGGPVEFERVVPPSGNMEVTGRQFWLGPRRAGQVITFWADTDVIHLTVAGLRVKPVRSHLSTADLAKLAATGARPAGPPPLPKAQPGAAIEVERTVSKDGAVHLANRNTLAAEILGGRRVGIRLEQNTLMFFDPQTRELLRTRPSPLTWDQACSLQGASPAGPPPRPSTEPITAQRRASNTGVIMIAGQKIALGRIHAGRVVTVHVAEHTITIDLSGDDTRTIRRTTTQPVRSIKAHRPRKARTTHVS